MVMLPEARAPKGERIYAVGDVHGCLDALETVAARIEADLARRPVGAWRVILVGDYVDRGPDSAGVMGWLAARADDPRHVFLIGNHDAMFVDFLQDPAAESVGTWLANGGLTTLASYGVGLPAPGSDEATAREEMRRELVGAMPAGHFSTLERLAFWHRAGDYLFVHAGVNPDRDLTAQSPHDLIWIREPFLSSTRDLGAVVVHGHTPRPTVTVRRNRIGIDTGAVFGGPLTCLVLEDDTRALLGPDGPEPLPEPDDQP